MAIVSAAVTILGGLLAASAFIIARKPNAKELIDKITPYQGWIGVALFLWGFYGVFHLITNLGWYTADPVFMLLAVGATAVNLGVGFLLGFGLITKYALSKNEAAMIRGQQMRKKLVAYQVPLGFCAIGLGTAYLLLPMLL